MTVHETDRFEWFNDRRALHLIDIENIAGGSDVTDVTAPLADYWASVPYNQGDGVIIAAGPTVMSRLMFEVQGLPCVLRCRSGLDGADLALLDAAPVDTIVSRFGRLVLGSGDHIFAPLVDEAGRGGVETVVVSRSSALSGALRQAAQMVVRLAEAPSTQPSRAAVPMPPAHNVLDRVAA